MPFGERAALVKAMLVHCATWRDTEHFIRPIVDPHGAMHHEHWRREVCRHLGYGFMDPDDAVACATLWSTGSLGPEAAIAFDVPVPAVLGALPDHREVHVTLAWIAPVRSGHLAYRAVKLRVAALGQDALDSAGIATTTGQPSNSQSEAGTIVHRRWCDAKIGDLAGGPTFTLQIQRERDQGFPVDEPVHFGLAVTIEMPGAVQIYEEVRNQILLQPQVPIVVWFFDTSSYLRSLAQRAYIRSIRSSGSSGRNSHPSETTAARRLLSISSMAAWSSGGIGLSGPGGGRKARCRQR